MTNSFSAAIGAWAAESKDRIQAVHRRSVELLAEEMVDTKPNGGRLPFLTGNLARSLLASTEGMPKASETPTAGSNVGAITATLELNQSVWLGYQAIYARRRNYGFVGADVLGRVFNEPGDYFVEGAIANWQQIVARAAAEIQASVESR
ncbi:hypothetical protein ACSBPU_05585 [Parapusillimonas sp. JC17]|uniref:hypothetical protein n=1 Tax=Parapusillimonas sp. JC17 TaxID=3445768 RepID=UPI003F9F9CEC